MPRMALCGGLRIGVDSSEPKTPPLVMVKVPPVRSSMLELSRRAPCWQNSRIARSISARLSVFGVAQDRHDQPALAADGDADVAEIVVDDLVAVDRGVDVRVMLERLDAGACTKNDMNPRRTPWRLLEVVPVPGAQVHDRLHVDLVERGQHRRGLLSHAPGARRCARAAGSWAPVSAGGPPRPRADRESRAGVQAPRVPRARRAWVRPAAGLGNRGHRPW